MVAVAQLRVQKNVQAFSSRAKHGGIILSRWQWPRTMHMQRGVGYREARRSVAAAQPGADGRERTGDVDGKDAVAPR
eukprot:5576904-Pyramimonas_sp.AAC.1